MTFDPTKPVQTRDGRKARILCTDAEEPTPIVALVTGRYISGEFVAKFRTDGSFHLKGSEETDLINVPEEETLYLPVRRSKDGVLFSAWPMRELAAELAARPALGHVCITVVGDKVTKAEVLP